MDARDLTPQVLAELRAPRRYPAVSLTMPTHRREPGHVQDPVRLRNLAAEAVRRLDEDPRVSRQDRMDLRAQLDRAVTEVDLRQAQDGLVIFVSAAEHQVWYVPYEVPERVVLSDSYLTRNLVSAHAHAQPYWVLAVSADRATLWSGAGETLEQQEGRGFPVVRPQDRNFDAERQERTGDTPSTFNEEETRAFLRTVDTALGQVLAERPRPFFLVGLAPALALLTETGSAATAAAGRLVEGGLIDGPGHALLDALRPVLDAHLGERQRQAAERLDEAAGRRRFAAGLDEVWGSVSEARAGLVVVEEHYRETVRVSDGHLAPVPAEEEAAAVAEPEVRDDIVDEIVERALATGSDIAFVPDDSLAGHGRIAAALRH
ncbi:chemotaxis protein [Streptomyces sp. NPDC092296]|uniref:baeRF3 domain-containing protein n=1 Tax=Streptomyces sp. NPDC092296 TaxID=3366012 RepID=UPI003829D97E